MSVAASSSATPASVTPKASHEIPSVGRMYFESSRLTRLPKGEIALPAAMDVIFLD